MDRCVFDDGETLHTIMGRKERPTHFANATYIGDFADRCECDHCPGKRIGCYSVLGAGTIWTRCPRQHIALPSRNWSRRPGTATLRLVDAFNPRSVQAVPFWR